MLEIKTDRFEVRDNQPSLIVFYSKTDDGYRTRLQVWDGENLKDYRTEPTKESTTREQIEYALSTIGWAVVPGTWARQMLGDTAQLQRLDEPEEGSDADQ